MTTKNFDKMTNKKLNALLETASEEDKIAIQEVLNARGQVATKQAEPQEQTVENQETENTENVEQQETEMPKKERMTDAERAVLAAELKEKYLYHRCQVVPFNTVDWEDGVVIGVTEDKRSNKVLFAVKLDDGRRIVKVHDSKLIKITDEVVEKMATRTKAVRERIERGEWGKEQMESDIAAVAVNVGKTVTYKDDNEDVFGRIVSIVPDKRSHRCLYRIEIAAPTDENPAATKIAHKVSTLSELQIAEDFDEAGMELNKKYAERRERIVSKEPLTPEAKYLKAEEALKKAEEAVKKAEEKYQSAKAALEAAKLELEPSVQTGENESLE